MENNTFFPFFSSDLRWSVIVVTTGVSAILFTVALLRCCYGIITGENKGFLQDEPVEVLISKAKLYPNSVEVQAQTLEALCTWTLIHLSQKDSTESGTSDSNGTDDKTNDSALPKDSSSSATRSPYTLPANFVTETAPLVWTALIIHDTSLPVVKAAVSLLAALHQQANGHEESLRAIVGTSGSLVALTSAAIKHINDPSVCSYTLQSIGNIVDSLEYLYIIDQQTLQNEQEKANGSTKGNPNNPSLTPSSFTSTSFIDSNDIRKKEIETATRTILTILRKYAPDPSTYPKIEEKEDGTSKVVSSTDENKEKGKNDPLLSFLDNEGDSFTMDPVLEIGIWGMYALIHIVGVATPKVIIAAGSGEIIGTTLHYMGRWPENNRLSSVTLAILNVILREDMEAWVYFLNENGPVIVRNCVSSQPKNNRLIDMTKLLMETAQYVEVMANTVSQHQATKNEKSNVSSSSTSSSSSGVEILDDDE